MWTRVVESMLACWLALSPFIFGHDPDRTWLWIHDFACAAVIMTFSLLSYNRPLHRMHLLNLLVAAWLVGVGYVMSTPPAEPAYQNHIVLGLLLGMFAMLPSDSQKPPHVWRDFYGIEREKGEW